MEYGIGDKSTTSQQDLTLANDDDWWNSLTTVLKECFTNTRIGLEVGAKGDSEIVYIWTLNSAADILSSGGDNNALFGQNQLICNLLVTLEFDLYIYM